MALSVRNARPGECEALTAIARRAKASHGYPDAWLAAWREELSFDAAYLARHVVLVAEDAGVPLDVAALEREGEAGQIAHLRVAPDAQRWGAGAALLRALVERARALGIVDLRIVSDPNAVGFYERQGARVVGSAPAPMPGAEMRVLPVLALAVHRGA